MNLIKANTRILLVEDDIFFSEIVLTYLTQYEYQVTLVPDGREAQLELSKNSYDLILADVLTPNLDGLNLLVWIRETCPAAKIILMSGYDEENILENKTKDENLRFLAKPFTSAELLKVIGKLLRK